MAKYISRTKEVEKALIQSAETALHRTAEFILMLIRLNVPVDTGKLRDSYKAEYISNLQLIIGTSLNYAIWVEFGSSRQAGQPHFLDSFLKGKKVLQKFWIEEVRKIK